MEKLEEFSSKKLADKARNPQTTAIAAFALGLDRTGRRPMRVHVHV